MAYKIPKLKPGAIIAIHWFDAHQKAEASGKSAELVNSNCELVDVGFYVGITKRFVVIAVERDAYDSDDYRHVHYIPRVNCTKIEVLRNSRDNYKEKK